MRVIAGKARRIPLVTVKGMETRPTTDRTKRNLIQYDRTRTLRLYISGSFSGSGAIGIEAISRGVKKAVFVEKQSECNPVHYGESEKDTAWCRPGGSNPGGCIFGTSQAGWKRKFDYVFMDPPYNHMLEKKEVLTYLAKQTCWKRMH